MANIPGDWLDFIDCLNGQSVEYVIVRAHALAFHELPRLIGFRSLKLKDREFADLDRIVQIGYPPVRIDVMSSISGVTFDEVWINRIHGEIEGRQVFFIGREELMRNKIASGRPKDLDDAKRLSRLVRPSRSQRTVRKGSE